VEEKLTPGQAFLAQRVQAGDDIIMASWKLMLERHDIAIDNIVDRTWLGILMADLWIGALAQRRLPHPQRKFRNTFIAKCRELHRAFLRQQNIRGKKAEDILRGDISVDALRRQITRARQPLNLPKRHESKPKPTR
jgi:hypothetical protein